MTWLMACATLVQGQVIFYTDNFPGGVTGASWAPAHDQGGVGFMNVNIQPGSTIRKAYLMAGRLGAANNLTVQLNGNNITFDNTNQATPIFQSIYGGNSAVHVADITALINPAITNYTLNLPAQTPTSDRYQEFYLYIAYQNPALDTVKTAIVLNDQDFQATHLFNVALPYTIDISHDVGVALYCGYMCNNQGDGEIITFESVNVGTIGGNDVNSGLCGGPSGSFSYQNYTLQGLSDDTPNNTVGGSDALFDAQGYFATNTNTFTIQFDHDISGSVNDNSIWGFILAFGGNSSPQTCVGFEASLGNDTAFCSGDSVVFAPGSYTSYLWQDGSTGSSFTANAPGTYWVGVANAFGCTDTDTVVVTMVYPSPLIDLGPDSTFCQGNSLLLDPGAGFTSYQWQNGSGNATFTAAATGLYWVEVTDGNGCKERDSVNISVINAPVINLGPDQSLCFGESLLLDPGPFPNYTWQDGSNGSTYTATTAGTYWVEVTGAAACPGRDSIIITAVYPLPVVDLGPDTAFCFGNSLLLNPGNHPQYLWQNGAGASTLQVQQAGIYWVRVTDANGCVNSDTMQVTQVFPLPQFTLGPDAVICPGDGAIRLEPTDPGMPVTYQWNDDSGNAFLNVSQPGTYILTLTSAQQCVYSDSLVVHEDCPPVIYIPAAFTPNLDGYNPVFMAYGRNIRFFRMEIFNRWGELIYMLNDLSEGWNGIYAHEPAPLGVYVYKVTFVPVGSEEEQIIRGSFSLIR